MSESSPLLPRPANDAADSHPIYLRVCHSPWRAISQKALVTSRFVVLVYLSVALGVSLNYKLNTIDEHTKWRIPFQFSTVAFLLLWAYHLMATLWTAMHLFSPRSIEGIDEDSRLKTKILVALSPPNRDTDGKWRLGFSLFYTTAHVFTFMNTIIYWAVLVPAGHGGFRPPSVPHHGHQTSAPGNPTAMYDPSKGLFEEGDAKAFSIINIWTISSVIGLAEILFFNSIRRPTPVAGHVAWTMFASALYLAWAGLGRLLTGHAGLFFLDPDLVDGLRGVTAAASLAFITLAPGGKLETSDGANGPGLVVIHGYKKAGQKGGWCSGVR
ncbi:uncharacterized protein BCR38DRAFT_478213 [Pseudomassariella vexata]|uniref:Uncharacterized protein n=1 Tax=Pseudomassariella vexata TaxID=1141098 RepID=A0A1Y2DDV6_9PEZI|nr:uncharacterized protein BCR38DRAFT_478213 [Pseudomassariella vexata]ORY57448.1 hypothetical protein BCR38DRAFT_478213 [Pseudomassariella vexata]